MSKPEINIPTEFAANGIKVDFPNEKILSGFDPINPDILPGDCLNKLIDDTYKGLNGVLELYEGCVLYDSGTTYNNKSLVFDVTNDGIKLYHSLQNGNINNPLTDTNYWETSSVKNFDGQWVCLTSNMTITSSTTLVKDTTYTYDISSFLPNDEYNYELILSAAGYTGTVSGNTANIYVRSDLNQNAAEGTLIARGMTRTSNTASWGGSINLIVGKQRQVHIINTGSANATNVFVLLNAYRRIGKNV